MNYQAYLKWGILNSYFWQKSEFLFISERQQYPNPEPDPHRGTEPLQVIQYLYANNAETAAAFCKCLFISYTALPYTYVTSV